MDADVPGYEGRLVVRYGRVPWSVISRAQTLIASPGKNGEGSLFAQVDFLVAACREIFVRNDADELEPIDPSGEPRRFDGELAELLHAETKTARETLRYVFANDAALAVQAGEVLDWTVKTDAAVSDELMGESAPAVK
jgi:hypothetical protein